MTDRACDTPPPRFPLLAILLLCLILVFLLSCAPKERIRIITQEVKMPVAVPCLAPEDVPAFPTGLGEMPLDANRALSLSLVKNYEWREYGKEADALLRICAGLPAVRVDAVWVTPTGKTKDFPPPPSLSPIPGGYLLRTQ